MKHFIPSLLILLWGLFSTASAQETNVHGTISCDGVGVPNVLVSDGKKIVPTDANGKFAFYSDKTNGYLFYILPAGYMPLLTNTSTTEQRIFPKIWNAFKRDATMDELQNFRLMRENNDNHIMLFMADPQVANRSNRKDMDQYLKKYFPRMREEYDNAGMTPIYTTVLGDLTWDYYWYSNNYDHTLYKSNIINRHDQFPFRHFSVIGNHDNDGATKAGINSIDFAAAEAFRRHMAPTYYSFNIGKIHYIVLDNIVYLNTVTPGKKYNTGIAGDRDYQTAITDEQFEWLAKDLSYVSKDTPIMVCMHSPAWKLDITTKEALPYMTTNQTTIRLSQMFEGYKNVYFFSGHRHQQVVTEPGQYGGNDFSNIIEHTLGALGGNLWATGYLSGVVTCCDGTPGGWLAVYVNGDSVSWLQHNLDDSNNYQFRVSDGNCVKEFLANSEVHQSIRQQVAYKQDFSLLADNEILVNVFNYDSKWKVEMFEGDQPLQVKHVNYEDPYQILVYDIPSYNAGMFASGDAAVRSWHMFSAVASSATSDILVKVTDRFGNVFQRNVKRPLPMTREAMEQGGEIMIPVGMTEKASYPIAQVYSSGKGKICISSQEAGTAVIADSEGRCRTVKINPGNNQVDVPSHHIYIVRTGHNTTKLFVR